MSLPFSYAQAARGQLPSRQTTIADSSHGLATESVTSSAQSTTPSTAMSTVSNDVNSTTMYTLSQSGQSNIAEHVATKLATQTKKDGVSSVAVSTQQPSIGTQNQNNQSSDDNSMSSRQTRSRGRNLKSIGNKQGSSMPEQSIGKGKGIEGPGIKLVDASLPVTNPWTRRAELFTAKAKTPPSQAIMPETSNSSNRSSNVSGSTSSSVEPHSTRTTPSNNVERHEPNDARDGGGKVHRDNIYGEKNRKEVADSLLSSSDPSSWQIPKQKNPGDEDSAMHFKFETSKMEPKSRDAYINGLAAEIFKGVGSYSRSVLERVAKVLPDLLRAFARKLRHKAKDSIIYNISIFVQQHCRQILRSFKDMFPPEGVARSDENLELRNYRYVVTKSPEFSWLVGILQREAILARAAPDAMATTRLAVLRELIPPHKLTRITPSHTSLKAESKTFGRTPTLTYKATFRLDWNPLGFLQEQKYTETPEEALQRAITITGSPSNAQALTTTEYLSQTWPATGHQIMDLLVCVIGSPNSHHAACILLDGTELDATILGSHFFVTVIGTDDSVVEIGEQFAWLGAALRSSPFDSGIAACSSHIQRTPLEDTKSSTQTSQLVDIPEFAFSIAFTTKRVVPDKELPGQCWQSMFRNPVMVTGYPILARHEADLGLEMPLDMISVLVGSNQVTEFNEKVFIKGFSAMAVATRVSENLLLWHYLYNEQGYRISYNEHIPDGTGNFNNLDLYNIRHLVGWSLDCKYCAGSADEGLYNVKPSNLPGPHSGCLLEKVSLTGGKWITGGITVAIGVKDIPVHLTRNGYIPLLRWVATRRVLLWDEKTKQGWLVNGTSALLHLVRTSLEQYRTGSFSRALLFDKSRLNNSNGYVSDSAIQVLIDQANRELEIWPGRRESFIEEEEKEAGTAIEASISRKTKRGYYLFEDLVEEHCRYLGQMIDHHDRLAGQNGVNLKARLRKHLEGWDFAELASGRDPRPRVATLQTLGFGWVDFIRSIGAITLFGWGFGEIIRPVSFDGMCPRWKRLPVGKYYMAATVQDLNDVLLHFSDARGEHLGPTHDLLWHSPEDIVSQCPCQKSVALKPGSGKFGQYQQHHDPVQVFYPKNTRLVWPTRSPGKLEESWAVVFGHSISWGYSWTDNGNEIIQDAPENSKEPGYLSNPFYTQARWGDSNHKSRSTLREASLLTQEFIPKPAETPRQTSLFSSSSTNSALSHAHLPIQSRSSVPVQSAVQGDDRARRRRRARRLLAQE